MFVVLIYRNWPMMLKPRLVKFTLRGFIAANDHLSPQISISFRPNEFKNIFERLFFKVIMFLMPYMITLFYIVFWVNVDIIYFEEIT